MGQYFFYSAAKISVLNECKISDRKELFSTGNFDSSVSVDEMAGGYAKK